MKESRPSSSSLSISTGTPGGRADRRRRLLAVARLAHGGGRHRPDLLGAELPRQPHLGRDDLGHLLDLLGQDRPVLVERPC